MEALVLVGGLGLRLREAIGDTPKPMAPINGRPFLEYLLDYLVGEGITRVILCTGYRHDVIYNYFNNKYKGIQLIYSYEKQTLGTGGAILNGLRLIEDEQAFVMNGDSIFNVDLTAMRETHDRLNSSLTIYIKKNVGKGRYHHVNIINQNQIIGFLPSSTEVIGSYYINGGLYLMGKNVFSEYPRPLPFSFENDFINTYSKENQVYGFKSDGYFMDIGVPDDYMKAIIDYNHRQWGISNEEKRSNYMFYKHLK